MPAIQCYALKYHRWRTTSCEDPSCSSSRGAFSFCSFVQIKLSFHRVQLSSVLPSQPKSSYGVPFQGLMIVPCRSWSFQRYPLARLRRSRASFVRLVTTYLMKYIEDWSVSMAHLIHKPIEATGCSSQSVLTEALLKCFRTK